MKIKITDLNLFEKTNGIYFTRDINFQYECEVLAICDHASKSIWKLNGNRKEFLLLLKYNNDINSICLKWCLKNNQ